MGSHYNQIRVDRCSRSQYAIKGMALDHDRIAMNVLQLRHGRDLPNQHPLRLTLFDADQFRWLILVDDMNKVQFCIRGAHQEAGLPQSAIGPRREICRGDDVHVRLLMIANGRENDACQVDQRGNWVLLRRAFDAAAGGLQSSDPAIWPGPTIWSRQGTDIAHRELRSTISYSLIRNGCMR